MNIFKCTHSLLIRWYTCNTCTETMHIHNNSICLLGPYPIYTHVYFLIRFTFFKPHQRKSSTIIPGGVHVYSYHGSNQGNSHPSLNILVYYTRWCIYTQVWGQVASAKLKTLAVALYPTHLLGWPFLGASSLSSSVQWWQLLPGVWSLEVGEVE